MRLSVTPIGSSRLSAGQIASAVVEYLAGVENDNAPSLTAPGDGSPATLTPGEDGTVGYYADSVEGPGRWLGRGAAVLGLGGRVERQAFAWVLEGRHPVSGERLLTAQGSADRGHLAVGQVTRRAPDGEWLYDLHDAASALGLPLAEVESLVAEADDRPGPIAENPVGLRAEGDAGGARWVRDSELDRFAARALAVTPEEVSARGEPDDKLGATEVARILGVSAQYVRSCCRYWQTHRGQIETLQSAELRPGRAWLVCHRDWERPGRPFVIRREQVAAFVERRSRPVVRVGYDLTLSTEKSIAVVALLDTGGVSGQVLSAIDAANDVALGYLERHASWGRRRGARVATEGLVVASFLHGTSRALDPFPHRHNVVANAVVDDRGERRALDARALYRHAPAAAALATAEMRWRLTRDMGVQWRRSARGTWEIAGVPDATIREFSTRRDEVDAALVELAEALGRPMAPADVDRVVLATRAAKARVAVEELRVGWWKRAASTGFGRRALRRCFDRGGQPVFDRVPPDLQDDLHDWLSDRLVEEGATFSHGDVVRAACEWTDRHGDLVVLPPHEVLRQAALFLASERVVELAALGQRPGDVLRRRDGRTVDNAGGEPAFTTVALLEREEVVFDAFGAGVSAGSAVIDRDVVTKTLGFEELSSAQREFLHAICGSGMAIQCAIGHPGSGKTHTLGVAARAWEAAGWRVLGAAVKGEAARLLAEATSVPTETVAWWLTTLAAGRQRWDSRTVVLVDESSTLSTKDLSALVAHARESGAVLRLVGDPAQHGAVGAGGLFSALASRHPSPVAELAENRRQDTMVDRFVAAAVRDGRVAEALASLKAAGQLTEVARGEDVYVAMITRWLAARHAGEGHPMIDRRNGTRRILNAVAHRVLQAEGAVAARGLTTLDGREFCTGDEIIARRPNRRLHPPDKPADYVRNGSRGRIVEIERDRVGNVAMVVDFVQLGVIALPQAFVEPHPDRRGRVEAGIDYGYALTSYAVQGATLPVSSSAITAGGSRRELYVNLTRGRRDNHLFVTAPADPAGGEGHLPRPPEADVVAEVLSAVGRRDEQLCATDLDPVALPAARFRAGRTLADIERSLADAGRTGSADEAVPARAAQLAAHATARLAVVEPPAWIRAALPERPGAPWLAVKWDAAVAAMAIADARHANDGQLKLSAVRSAAGEELVGVWVPTMLRRLGERAAAGGADQHLAAQPLCWLEDHLTALARGRALGPGAVSADSLLDLYLDVAEYRGRWNVVEPGGPGASGDVLLGERPRARGPQQTQWDRLATRMSLVHAVGGDPTHRQVRARA